MSTRLRRLQLDRARLYDQVRTAHLERAHQLAPAAIVYRSKRYDFDERLADGLELIQAGAAAAAGVLARSRIVVLEVNEPLNLAAMPRTALVLAVLAARTIFTRRKPLVVTYAIENMSPFSSGSGQRFRTRIRRRIEHRLARYVWRRVDRVAYGTGASRDLYREVLPSAARRAESLVPALPEPCACDPAVIRESHLVVFLGALSDRKGFPKLVQAWPLVRERDPLARLAILGKGKLEGLALETARSDASIEVLIDPPREEIHRRLRASQVLALPSQRTATWREQVGLPIIEGLAHGCSIVTTTETGISEWLAAHGHGVLDPECTPDELAAAIAEQLERNTPTADVLTTLPSEDGRLSADRWLFETEPRLAHASLP